MATRQSPSGSQFTIGVCGAGRFASSFIPLFKAHPLVGEVRLAEAFPERRAEQAARFGIEKTYASLDELCDSDVDAIALFTQRWLHGPQAVQALEAGKHVYSAVPAAITLEEVTNLVQAVERTGLVYMNGETSYYYPSVIYCRERFAKGDFGRFVYGEGCYTHDMEHGFYAAYQHSGGDEWKKTASFPPMLYPTHSTSMIISVTGERFTHVSCFGQVDEEHDGVFEKEVSLWQNEFSNEVALFRTADGGMARMMELRRIGLPQGNSNRMCLYGTKASFEEQWYAKYWVDKDDQSKRIDLLEALTCRPNRAVSDEELREIPEALRDDFFAGVSSVHPVQRLPREFRGLRNGHQGSHQFLACDFVEAVANRTVPPNNVWQAARYCLPGIVAHESAKRGGELMEIPDFGDPPRSGYPAPR
ncbi:MAG TPA: Gfo/Idh/MocA family oxidoreductase [Chloroflexota bacterium]|nr:Gfo/Idh/MocA family oxidoreductase [Chloroflexota bacterium]